MLKIGTTNDFRFSSRKRNLFLDLSPNRIFIIFVLCLYLFSWALMLSVFRFTFSYTLSCNSQYSFEYSMTVLSVSQVMGMLSYWFIVKTRLPVTKTLLIEGILCFSGSMMLFFLQQRYIIYMFIVLFFLFGQIVALTTTLFQKYIPKTKRLYGIGLILVSNSAISYIIRSFSMRVTLINLFFICIFATLLIAVLSISLYVKPLPEPNIDTIRFSGLELNRAYFHLLVYISTVSFIKGILFQHIPILFLQYSSIASSSLSIGYIICILVFTRFVKKRHIGISIYISNSIFLFAFIFFMGFSRINWLSILFAAMIYATFALNDLFSFDLLFAFGDRYADSSNIFGVGFGIYVFSVYLGQITAMQFQKLHFFQIEFLIILTYSIATLVLPYLRLEISKLQLDSIFRVDPVLVTPEVEQLDLESNESTINEGVMVTPDQPTTLSYDLLSQRENEVLVLLLKGYPNDLIASSLYISNNTLKKHIQSIYNKLGVHSRSELFLLFNQNP